MGQVVREPTAEFTLISADAVVPNADHKVLITGLVDAATYDNVRVHTDKMVFQNYGGVENVDFGPRSQLANMVREFKEANSKSGFPAEHVTKFDVKPILEAVGGTAGTIVGTIAGTSTAAGTIDVAITSLSRKVTVAIPSGTAAADAAGLIKTAWDLGDLTSPYVLAAPTAVMTWTCVHKGQDIDVGFMIDVSNCPGITLTSFIDGVAGAVNPDLTDVFDNFTNIRYNTVAWPFDESGTADIDDISEPADFLDARFNAEAEVLDGVAVCTMVDVVADHSTKLALLNSKSLVTFLQQENDGETRGEIVTPFAASYELTARFCGLRARRFTADHNISDIVIASASLDQRGGPGSASLPYHNTPIDSELSFDGLGFTRANIKALEALGGSIIGENIVGNATILGAVRTTYKNDSAGNPDPTWGFLNYVDTSSQIREYMVNNVRDRYAQSRLTEGILVRDREQENAESISAFMDKLYSDLSGRSFALTQAGEGPLNFFKDNKTVDLNLLTGTVTIFMKVPIVTQIRNVIATIQIAFTVEEG